MVEVHPASLKDEPGGWGAVVMEELRANPTQYIEIREVDAGYDIEVDIPRARATRSPSPRRSRSSSPPSSSRRASRSPRRPLVIEVSGATDVLAGASLAGGLSEADVIADRGPWHTTHNPTITLVNDTWLAAAPALVASRALVSAQAEAHGWNAIIRSSLSARLESDTALTLSFEGGEAAGDGYDISAPETVAVEVPAAACSSGQDVPIVPSFIIRAVGPRLDAPARTRAHAPQRVERARARRPGVAPAVPHPRRERVDARRRPRARRHARGAPPLVSEQAEAAGWNAIVRVGLEPRHVARIDDATLRLTVPQFALLDLGARDDRRLAAARRRLVRLQPHVVGPPRRRARGRAFVSGGSLPREPAERRCAPGRRPSRSSCSATRG